jgi:hypothetical protein
MKKLSTKLKSLPIGILLFNAQNEEFLSFFLLLLLPPFFFFFFLNVKVFRSWAKLKIHYSLLFSRYKFSRILNLKNSI